MYYTPDDVISLIDSLEEPYESEVVEFKEAKSSYSFKELGRYFSALSNEALIRGKRDAWLFFGLEDHKTVKGTNYRRDNPRSLQSLKNEIAGHVNTRSTFREIFELNYKSERVIAFQIPPAIAGMPTAFDKAAWSRDGSSLVPLSVDKYEEIRQMRQTDWTGEQVAGAKLEVLDEEAVNKAIELFLKKHEAHKEAFADMTKEELLEKAGITSGGKVTAASIILLGKPESARLLQGATPRITWTLYASDGSVMSYEHFDPPLLLAEDRVLAKIRNEKYRFLANGESLFPVEIMQYDPEIIRELLNNCIAHQDYSMQGRINVEEFEDHLVFINGGTFIPGSIERAMKPGYKPPYYRNPFLCDAMVQLDMIDTIAKGIPMIYSMQRKRYFPLPSYDLSDPNQVSVSVYGKSINESYSRLLFARPDLPLGIVYLLDKIQKHEEISKEQAAELHDLKLVEGRYPNLTITSAMASASGYEAEYERSKGLNDQACKSLILQMLEETGPAPRGKIVSLVRDLLPSTMTDKQKARKVSNLLASMKNADKSVICIGAGKGALWSLPDKG